MVRRVEHQPAKRISSDYTGAGVFTARGDLFLINTDYGVQAVDTAGRERWRAELGSRCLGVVLLKDEEAVATCLDGLYVLDMAGKRKWGTHSKREAVCEPVLFRDGIVLSTVQSVHYLRDWNGPEWRFDLREALGPSVQAARVLDAFELEGHLILGAVDYDTGIGRVVVLDEKGQTRWQSEPGPLSGLFPAGAAVFVWSLSGYGRFESHMARPDGKEIWRVDFGGTGVVHPDGSISMLVGSNESPAWDDWEYRRLSPAGKAEKSTPVRGRSAVRPLLAADGSVYFTGYSRPLDPSGSRMDYTSFSPQPAMLAIGHKTGMNAQPPEYHLYFQRVTPASRLELLGEETESVSFSRPVELEDSVFFTSGGDLIGFRKG